MAPLMSADRGQSVKVLPQPPCASMYGSIPGNGDFIARPSAFDPAATLPKSLRA